MNQREPGKRWRALTWLVATAVLGLVGAALVAGMADPPFAKLRLRDGRLLVIEAVSRPDEDALRGPLLSRELYLRVPEAWRNHLGVENYSRTGRTLLIVWYRLAPNREGSSSPPVEVADANGAVGTGLPAWLSGDP